ncbi:MAG: hypothetical protein WC468_00815 [Candidatus Paceibacterota bacterium]
MSEEDIPLSYFYLHFDHFSENREILGLGEFGDYTLLLRYKSGLLKIWDVERMKARWIEAR